MRTKFIQIVCLLLLIITIPGCIEEAIKVVMLIGGVILPTKYVDIDSRLKWYYVNETIRIDVYTYASWLYGPEPVRVWIENRSGQTVYSTSYMIEDLCDTVITWITPNSGYYSAHVRFIEDKGGIQSASSDFSVNEGTGGTTIPIYQVEIWSGNKTSISSGEILKYPFAYQIAAEAKTEGGSLPTERVSLTFQTTRGLFDNGETIKTVYTSEVNTLEEPKHIAKIFFIAPTDIPSGNVETITISCFQTDDPRRTYKADFTVYCMNDNEASGLSGGTHQKNPPNDPNGIEVKGDNIADAYESGTSAVKKDIRVYINWYRWSSNVDINKIHIIKNHIVSILETAGLSPSIEINSSPIEANVSNPTMDFSGRQDKLNELYNSNVQGRLHLIIGTVPAGLVGVGGITQCYKPWAYKFLTNQERYSFAQYSSGPDNVTVIKRYVGCFVFPEQVINMMKPTTPLSVEQALAMAATHEIGHALGLMHYTFVSGTADKKNIMHTNLEEMVNDPFVNYGKFYVPTLDGSNDDDQLEWDGMNTKHILGIDCADIRETSLP